MDAERRPGWRQRGAVLAIAGVVLVLLGVAAFVFDRRVLPSGVRFARTIAFDGNGLVLAPPPPAAPAFAEADAIALFRSTSMPTVEVSDVWIGYATATVRAEIPSGDDSAAPRFDHTPAWVIVDHPRLLSCPLMTGADGRSASSRTDQEVFLVDAATGAIGVQYQPRGFGCFPAGGPYVHPAKSYVSLPWTLVGVDGVEATVSVTTDGCTPVSGSGSSGVNRTDLAVFAARTLMPMKCPGPIAQQLHVPIAPVPTTPVHAPTGPVVGIATADGGFTYREGPP
jgi:hypothetical protein